MKTIYDLPDSKGKERLLLLPNITPEGVTPWIYRIDFGKYGFNTTNGIMRRGTPEHFPKGMQWERFPEKGTIQRLRCLGFSDDFKPEGKIRSDIHKIISKQPCMLTGDTKVEVDHRAGNKEHPLHQHVDDPEQQQVSDFMPLCREMNQKKREICKKCTATGQRPGVPLLYGGGEMKPGEGCNGCFWMQPELYV